MNLQVYIAGRSEDQSAAKTLRDRLAEHGIGCTSRWLDGFIDNHRTAAVMCIVDIARGDAVVVVNPPKVHRTGTGGRHVETGIAIATGKPVVVLGARENVFHHMDSVRCVPPPPQGSMADIVEAIRELTSRPAVGR